MRWTSMRTTEMLSLALPGAAARRSQLRAGNQLPRRPPLLGCRQRQRDLLEPAVLRRVLRSRHDPRRFRLLPDRHHHAHHAGAADSAFPRSGELAVHRLRVRPPGPRPGLPPGRRQEHLRRRHLGSEFPLPQRNLLHLRQREPLRPSGVSAPPIRAVPGSTTASNRACTISPSCSTTTARSTPSTGPEPSASSN